MDRNPPRSRNRDDDAGEPPAAIHGRIIRASKLKLLGMWVLAVVFFVACGYMLLERWVLPEANRVLPFRLTWWGSLLSVIGFLIALIGIVALLFEFLCLKQLVLGDEAFQVVRRWVSGTTVVELHIPYANIKAVVYEKRGDDWQLGIDLYDPDDETYGFWASSAASTPVPQPRSSIGRRRLRQITTKVEVLVHPCSML